jgi:hypothetical protein
MTNESVPEDPFKTDLRKLLNYHSKDTYLGMHDFVLAEHLSTYLDNLRYTLNYERGLSGD